MTHRFTDIANARKHVPWRVVLEDDVRQCNPGDVIEVPSNYVKVLGEGLAVKLYKEGLTFVVVEEPSQ